MHQNLKLKRINASDEILRIYNYAIDTYKGLTFLLPQLAPEEIESGRVVTSH